MKIIFTTTKSIKATKVMRLGATHNGINLSKYSARGDHIYWYVMLSVPPVYLKLTRVSRSNLIVGVTICRDI